MNTHQKFTNQIADFLNGTLSSTEKKSFEAHLNECDSCRASLENFRNIKSQLKQKTNARLSPEAHLRLYEQMNTERKNRGEKLLRIPAELIAQVKAKSVATGQAMQDLTTTGVESATDVAQSGTKFGGAMVGGAKNVSGKMAKTAQKGVKRAQKIVSDACQTATSIGRTMGEAAEIAGDARKSPLKAVTAPPKLAGKGIKMGGQIAKGSVKMMGNGMKGGIEMIAGGADTAAEMMTQAGKVTKAIVDGIDTTANAKKKIIDSASKGAKSIANANPKPKGSDKS